MNEPESVSLIVLDVIFFFRLSRGSEVGQLTTCRDHCFFKGPFVSLLSLRALY